MKVWNYVFIGICMSLFFYFAGYSQDSTTLTNYGVSMNTTNGNTIQDFNFDLSGFFIGLLLSFSTLLGAGISISLYYAGKPEIAIKAGLVSTLFVSFITSLIFPIKKALELQLDSWAIGILAMIFIPFTIGYAYALVEYVIGGNTD